MSTSRSRLATTHPTHSRRQHGSQLPAARSSSASAGVGGLTMNDFLTLMTAQLQNQDPLNPTDSNQFLSAALRAEHGRRHLAAQYLGDDPLEFDAVLAGADQRVAGRVRTSSRRPASASYTSGQPLSGAVQVPDAVPPAWC